MLGLDELVDGVFGGSPLGLGLIAVGAVVAVAGPRAKPLAKGAIKGYLATTERAREWLAEASEQMQDIYAEAKHEYESELAATPAAAAGTDSAAPAGTAPTESSAASGSAPNSAAPGEARSRRRGGPASGLVTPSGEPA